jgi:hypothetical protein
MILYDMSLPGPLKFEWEHDGSVRIDGKGGGGGT